MIPGCLLTRRAAWLALICVVSGCGGGGGGGDSGNSSPNRAPLANAGADQTAFRNSAVTLDGSASNDADGNALTYTWTQIAGPTVALSNATGPRPSFIAPAITGSLAFSLVVSDGQSNSAADSVGVAIQNRVPTANAGTDHHATVNQAVTLDGRQSVDPDGDALTYAWRQVEGPTVTLRPTGTGTLEFTAPATSSVLTFALSVSDGELTSTEDIVTTSVSVTGTNRAPLLDALLRPATAYVTDTLTVDVDASDPDNDPLEVTYAWTRNGTVIPGQTGSTLPAHSFVRGDVIAVTVTATDGIDAIARQRSVTIADSLPVLSTNAPAQVTFGNVFSFRITATDADNDPIVFAIKHGPPGMSVSSSGDVTWTPNLPMFGPTLDVNWGVGVAGITEPLETGWVQVVDNNRDMPMRRTAIETPVRERGLILDDLDGDGEDEMLVGSRHSLYEMQRSGGNYFQGWVYPFDLGNIFSSSIQAIAAADVDADNHKDIFVATQAMTVRLDGRTRRESHRFNPGTNRYCADIEAIDLNNDGDIELVCLSRGPSVPFHPHLVVFDARTGGQRWQSPELSGQDSLAFGNFDNDPALEIVTSGGDVFDGASFATEWAAPSEFGSVIVAGDIDGDSVDEVIASLPGIGVRAYDVRTRTVDWQFSPALVINALEAHDVNGDGDDEVIVGSAYTGLVKAYEVGAGGSATEVFSIDTQGYDVTAIGWGNTDADGTEEIVWMTGGWHQHVRFEVASGYPTPVVEWSGGQISATEGRFSGGQLATIAPGQQRLIFGVPRTEGGIGGTSGSRILALDPSTGRFSAGIDLGEDNEEPLGLAISDYDLDGVDEVFATHLQAQDNYFTGYEALNDQMFWREGPVGTSAWHIDQAAVAMADVTGDGRDDLIGMSDDGAVHVYDVHGMTALWTSAPFGNGADIAAADLDGDNIPEIVAAQRNRVTIYERASSGPQMFVQRATYTFEPAAVTFVWDVLIADTDGDSTPEIRVLISHGDSASMIHCFDAQLQLQLQSTVNTGQYASSLSLEDVGTGRKNLVLGTYINIAGDFTGLMAIDASSGATIWRSPPLAGDVYANNLHYVDVDSDGLKEISFADSSGMVVTQ